MVRLMPILDSNEKLARLWVSVPRIDALEVPNETRFDRI